MRKSVSRFVSAAGDPDVAVSAWRRCWPNAVISYESAAAFHGLPVTNKPTPQITVLHGHWVKPSGLDLHSSRRIDSGDRIWDGAVPYTTLARTVCDLADPAHPWTTFTLVDNAIALGASQSWLHHRAQELSVGRPGCVLVRGVTAPGSAAVFRSWLERTAAHVYRAGHLRDPQWNVAVRDAQGRIGIADALWPEWMVISEKEGLRFHTSPARRNQDAERFNRYLDARYAARRFTWLDVVQRPIYVVETLARPLIAAGAPVDLARIPRHIEVPDAPFGR